MAEPGSNQSESTELEEERDRCANCGKKMAKKGKFCPHCGQRRFEGKVPFKELSTKLLYKITNLDNKILRMSWRLLIPGQVTLDYFQGKIKQYPHPFQFFFVVMFFFLFVFSKVVDTSKGLQVNFGNKGKSNVKIGLDKDSVTQAKVKQLNQLKKKEEETTNIDSINKGQPKKGTNIYFQMERFVFGREFETGYDSLPPKLQTPEVKEAIKIILDTINRKWTSTLQITAENSKIRDSFDLKMFEKRKTTIALKDIVEMTPEEITEKYQVTGWISKIMLKQGIRSLQNPSDLISAYIGSFSWTILSVIIAMAGLLQLFYWTQNRYYVEHFVFLMHLHTGLFLVFTLMLGISYYFPLGNGWQIVFVGAAIFTVAAMKRYYGQSWWLTLIKWFFLQMLYVLCFTILFAVGLLVVFAIF
jgi:phage FluMu protein Com